MSEKEIKTETKTEETKVNDVVADNVALLKSENISLKSLNKDLAEKLDAMTTKFEQAKEFVDGNAKADLLAYISPRYDMAPEYLMLKTKDELMEIKYHIDKVEHPAFKAGTKVVDNRKTSQRAKLESTFDVAQARRREASK